VFLQIRPDSFVNQDGYYKNTNDIKDALKTHQTDNGTIIEGEVLITKNPCSHPGDI
jgi:hypothetical protein